MLTFKGRFRPIKMHLITLLMTTSSVMATLLPKVLHRRTSILQPQAYCGNTNPPTSLLEQHQKFQRIEHGQMDHLTIADITNYTTIDVNVYMHVISEKASQWPGNASLELQMETLQTAFAPHGIMFHHVNTSHSISPTWAYANNEMFAKDIKPALKRGKWSDLNLYYAPYMWERYVDNFEGIIGECPFPDIADYIHTDCEDVECLLERDGCVMDARTLPLSRSSDAGDPYFSDNNQGKITIHEVGHWLGLLHPFHSQQGNICLDGGDFVDDTPPQGRYTSGCPKINPDTCPGSAGLDAIHNYMDYSSDVCRTHFTYGQVARIYEMYEEYRRGR